MTTPNVQPDEAASQRAKFVAGLREFATWVEERPWVPITPPTTPDRMQRVRLQVNLEGQEGLDQVRSISERLSAEIDEGMDDRTSVHVRIGSAEYSVIAWHREGRARMAELEKLPAELAELKAQAEK